MNFLSPWYLLGALSIAVPVWVHLIRHDQAKPVPFASLMFFRRIPQRTVSRKRLKHFLLLAARCALILLLALAFARPYFTRAAAPVTLGPRARLHVVMVDRSLSMQYGDRAARAAATARQALDRMGGQDQAQMIAFDSEARVLNAPTSDRGALRALLASELKPGALPTNFPAALRALEKLAQQASLPVAAYLISDLQKSGWTTGTSAPALPASATFELISVDENSRPNFAVSEMQVTRETFLNRFPRRLQARVAGYGTAAARKELILSLNGREVERRTVDLPPAGSASVMFESFELPPGASRGEIRMIPGDELPQDDVRYFTLMRREPYRVMYLSGADSARELLYLREALASGEEPMFTIEPRTLSAGSEALKGYAAVVISNAPSLPARLASRLKEYVEEGGGVMAVLGDRSDWASLARAGTAASGHRRRKSLRAPRSRAVRHAG